MPADVSQFIQMQRLLSIESRQPSRSEMTLTYLHQKQIAIPLLGNFLADPKKKNTDISTIKQYYYIPVRRTKRTVPITSSWVGQYKEPVIPSRRIDGGSPNQTGPGKVDGGSPNQTGPGKIDGGRQ